MSESSSRSPDKSGESGSCTTIGYRFYSGSEELGEVQSEQFIDYTCTNSESNLDFKMKPNLVSSGSLDTVKYGEGRNDLLSENVKDYWGFLGRSISVDSSYQSPFSNPLESWKKLNELKGKITKTVEEKISEMKMDHNSSNHFKLNSSKENSSISDSEDTSEGSKLSEQWKDTEDLNTSLKEVISKTTDMLSSTLDAALQNAKSEVEAEGELRFRKSHAKFSDLIKISDIKIATAKSDLETRRLDDNITEDIESGVEAEENLDSVSLDAFDDNSLHQSLLEGSQTPPGGSGFVNGFLGPFISEPFTKLNALVLLVGWGLYFLMPMSDFSKGFAFCLLIVILFWKLRNYFIRDDSLYLQQGNSILPDFNLLPPLKIPEHTPVKGVWLNEYESEFYDPDYYSVTQTVPVYLELDNSILKLSRPKGKIAKRATIDEPEYKLQFLNQRVYNISGCNVFLLPEGLTRKRLYSKKYPIVIFLKSDSFIGEKNLEEKENSETVEKDDMNLTLPTAADLKGSLYLFSRCDRQKEEWYRKLLAATKLSHSPTPDDDKTEKEHELHKKQHHHILPNQSELNHKSESHHQEHWNHKKHAERENQKKPVEEQVNVAETSTPFENIFFDPEVAQMEEYLRYMAKFVDVAYVAPEPIKTKSRETWSKKNKKKKGGLLGPGQEDSVEQVNSVLIYKKSKASRISRLKIQEEPEYEEPSLTKPSGFPIQWFNAFLNRILFDVFRSPYWLAKIHEKLYKKLNSIRLPYYVEEIEVIEMDLGKTGPLFRRVSQPYLDERGLWFDMDTTFDGLIKLTIQTHLNLVKLQKGMQEEEAIKNIFEKPAKSKKKAKEMKDTFLMRDSQEKCEENLDGTKPNKKLEKSTMQMKSPSLESETHGELYENYETTTALDQNPSDLKLLKEVTRIAEIALEDENDTLSQNILHGEGKTSVSETINERRHSKSPIYDSEVEDSAESSEEDVEEEEEATPITIPHDAEEPPPPVSAVRRYPKNRRSSKKLFRMFENVAQSKYFKSVAQSKYIQKAIAGVSATKLKLTLEIKSCSGTLAVNIPPPPSDRFWYGFRDMPDLIFSANPKIGEKPVRFFQIKSYLQRKILHEIKKTMVMPNMIDFVLPTSIRRQQSSTSFHQKEKATPPGHDHETNTFT